MSNDHPALTLPGPPPACRGPCRSCGGEHILGHGRARDHCLELMRLLGTRKSLDLFSPPEACDPRLATASLYGEARGKMFGVMECLARDGSVVLLRAFSGQFNGFWDIDGWAPPLFDSRRMAAISVAVEREIKRLGQEMAGPECSPLRRRELQQQRRQLSQDLMRRMHGLYRLANFRGEGNRPLFGLLRGERHSHRHRRLLRPEAAQPCGPAESSAARHGGILLGQGEPFRRQTGKLFLSLLPGKVPADPRFSALRPGGAPCATPTLN